MLFNSLQYGIFLALVLVALRFVPSKRRATVLLAASLFFYALWLPVYLLLLLADLVVNYALLRAMARSARPRLYLGASVVFTLSLLFTFKYAVFAAEALVPFLGSGLLGDVSVPEFFLPLGISFYSFQIIALTVDTFRSREQPVESFAQYALFISFFPQLIAGPILRGSEMLPQLAAGGAQTGERTHRGAWLLVSGLTKKVVFADFLLAPFVDDAFMYPQVGSAAYHLVAAYSFLFQVYFDFSGYVDMARGSALLMGFEIPSNFREPYLARNPAEFWQRWHITLSTWLRDYIYVPLGGNRRGRGRTYVNLFLTMVIGGLWHGAAWTFVLWGALHGILLIAHRLIFGSPGNSDRPLSRGDIPGIIFTFHASALLQSIFRAPSLAVAGSFLAGFGGMDFATGWPPLQTAIVVVCIGLHFAERRLRSSLPRLRQLAVERPWGPPVEGMVAGLLIGIAYALSGAGGEFIYFQF